MKSYQAYGTGNCRATCSTPRAAALAFFAEWPAKRKCNVVEGVFDGTFFTITYSRENPPQRWKDVTPKTALTLPTDKVQS